MNAGIDFEQLVRGMGDAVVIGDPDGRIVFWNAAATRLFGFGEAEAMGQPLELICPERLRGRHSEGYAKTAETGVTRYGTTLLKVPAQHQSGRSMSIAFTVSLLTAADGKVTGIAAVIRDETERFEADRALRKRIAQLEEAAGGR